ncbi:hypothetical protein HBH96_137160 [Parastagonospora nodorum]|nr:hypothetical protein HBH96_137160 [Parastagonospora nodorum]KAH5205440.1 hypothetical protein HBH77_101230 [Parastagonospora nodorum]KAH5772793.1 hypothetical protein HBI16_114800 [Parastagonospora nodorum]
MQYTTITVYSGTDRPASASVKTCPQPSWRHEQHPFFAGSAAVDTILSRLPLSTQHFELYSDEAFPPRISFAYLAMNSNERRESDPRLFHRTEQLMTTHVASPKESC